MNTMIESDASKVLLNVLLSCRCPIKAEVENEIISFYLKYRHNKYLNYDQILKIAEETEDDTVFHRLREFCIYPTSDFKKNLIITKEDVFRHFCSGFHWRVVEDGIEEGYPNLKDIPSWFIGHMLLPIKITKTEGTLKGNYVYLNKKIELTNIFMPPDIRWSKDECYCIHFASVISIVNAEQSKMISNHLEEIDLFKRLREDVNLIDYHRFQKFGNYQKICSDRYLKYFRNKNQNQ